MGMNASMAQPTPHPSVLTNSTIPKLLPMVSFDKWMRRSPNQDIVMNSKTLWKLKLFWWQKKV